MIRTVHQNASPSAEPVAIRVIEEARAIPLRIAVANPQT